MMNILQKIILLTAAILLSAQSLANNIALHKAPNTSSKTLSTLPKGTQLIPIYYPNKGNWIKVANPKNGQVGWVTFDNLKGKAKLPGFAELAFTQHIETHNNNQNNPQAYRIIQYSGPKKLNPDEIKELVRQMQMRQSKINATMQLMLHSMLEDFNNFAHMEPLAVDDDFFTFPKLQPMLVVPSDNKPLAQSRIDQKTPKPSWWKRMTQKLA